MAHPLTLAPPLTQPLENVGCAGRIPLARETSWLSAKSLIAGRSRLGLLGNGERRRKVCWAVPRVGYKELWMQCRPGAIAREQPRTDPLLLRHT
jgi:hypothetical protein